MVVEGTKKDFRAKKFPQGAKRKISGETLCKIVDTFERKYNLRVYWEATRRKAKIKILELLREEESKLLVRKKGNNNNYP